MVFSSLNRSGSQQPHLSQEDNTADENAVTVPLLKHLYHKKILSILPIESNFETYTEVEADQFFISCRSLIMNIALSSDLNDVVENTLNLIDIIIQDNEIISSQITDKAIHSILILLRLLSDIIEYYMDDLETYKSNPTHYQLFKRKPTKDTTDKDYIDMQNKFFVNSAIGYSTVRAGFHEKSPKSLDKKIATRLMDTCAKLRFNCRNLKVMKNMCTHLFSHSTSSIYQKILPDHQNFLKKRTDHKILAMVDIALKHILRYSSAANPEQYFEFLKNILINPLADNLSNNNDLKCVQNVELLGFVYLDKTILSKFFDIISFINNLKKPLFTYLVLYFSSKSLFFWIMSRPKDYLQIYQKLENHSHGHGHGHGHSKYDSSIKILASQINSLFEDVYSNSSALNVLSTTHLSSVSLSRLETNQNTNSNTRNPSDSTSSSVSSSSITSQDKLRNYNEHKSRRNSSNSENNRPVLKPKQSPLIFNTPTINALSLLNSPKHSSTDVNQYFQSRIPSNVHNSFNNYNDLYSTSFVNNYKLPFTNDHKRDSCKASDINSNISLNSSINLEVNESVSSRSTNNTPLNSHSDFTYEDSLNSVEDYHTISRAGVLHIENVLDVWLYFGDNESLPHTAVLTFMTSLLMLDTDVFCELNLQSFKNLRDVELSQSAEERGNDQTSLSKNQIVTSLEKEKNLYMKHFTSGLRKLKYLQPSKKKSVKFVESLINKISGLDGSVEYTHFDSIMAIVHLFGLSAPVARDHPNFPAVIFSRRLIELLGVNLTVGEGWNKNIELNNILQESLKINPSSHFQMQVKFITAALQLNTENFMDLLNMMGNIGTHNLQTIALYIESFRIFFYLPISEKLRKYVASKTSDFFKSSFRLGSEATLQSTNSLDEDISKISNAILDGTILDENGVRINNNIINDKSSSLSNIPSEDSLLRAFENGIGIENDGLELNWSPNSMHRSTSTTTNGDDINSTADSIGHVILPKPMKSLVSHPLNRRKSPLSLYDSDIPMDINTYATSLDTQTPSISSQLMMSTTSTPLQRDPKPSAKHTSGRLRRFSEESSVKVAGSPVALISEPSIDIENVKEFLLGRQITINILNTFKRMTSYFILPHDKNPNLDWVTEDFQNIIKPVLISILETDETLQTTAQLFMNVLLEYINEYGSNKSAMTIKGYLTICTYTACLLAVELLNLHLSNSKRAILLDILIKYLKLRASLITSSQGTSTEYATFEVESSTYVLLHGTVTRAIFISFYSNDSKVQNSAIRGNLELFRFLKSYKGKRSIRSESSDSLSELIVKDTAFATSGATAFQRRIRNAMLCMRGKPDTILLDCVEKIFRRWYYFFKLDRKKTRKNLWDFRNLAGILSAISGLFLRMQDDELITNPTHIDETEKMKALRNDFSYFISKQCEWLNNSDLLTRENARDLISSELHPYSFNVLFNLLLKHINQIINLDLSISENELSFVLLEQIIIIIRTILKRDDIGELMIIYSSAIIDVIETLTLVVNQMPKESSKYLKAVIHMSKMFSAIQISEDVLAIKHHYYLKNKWLKLVISWFRISIQRNYDIENLAKPHREMNLQTRDMDYLYIDTAIESSKAIVYLTGDLPLEVYYSKSKEEIKRSKIVFFGKYFNILLKGFEKSMDVENYPVTVKHKMNLLNENVILSLTNISKANTEVSVQFTLPMGYSYNKNIKIAFLKVFTNMLSRYPHNNGQLEDERLSAIDNVLLYLIQHPDLIVYGARICPANDVDQLAAVGVNAFEIRNASHIIIAELIKDEIKHSSGPSDILRRNSCATKSLAILSKDKCPEYLIKTLRPVLQKIIDENITLEIEKLDSDDPNVSGKVDVFVKYFGEIIETIIKSLDDIPQEFFYISQSIYVEAEKKFPHYGYVAVGSFIFLRLICPALVSPETENIIGTPNFNQRRLLLALAKVLQGLANKSDYLTRWPILQSRTEFFEQCSVELFSFLKKVCDPERNISIEVRMTGEPKSFDYSFIHQFLYQGGVTLRRDVLSTIKSTKDIPYITNTLILIDHALGQLGEPKIEYKNEIPENIKDLGTEYPQLYEFMSRFAFKKYKQISRDTYFIRELLSSDGIPTLSVAFDKFLEYGVEVETIVFKLVQLYARIWSSKHYLLFDCTEYDEESFDYAKFIIIINNIIPDFVAENCEHVYFVNVNDSFLKHWEAVSQSYNFYLSHGVQHSFINTNSDGELIKFLKVNCQGLEVLEDVRVSLHDIMMYDEKNNRLSPVSLKLGNKYFQVLHETPRQCKISQLDSIINVKVNDVYQLSIVSSTELSMITGVAGEFALILSSGQKLIFCSPKYLEIMKMFKYVKSREETDFGSENLRISLSDVEGNTQQIDEQNDLIGHLLLVVIVGLFDTDDTVKSQSYNLLTAAERAYKLNLGSHFHKTPEVYIPADVTILLSTMAKSLSSSHPEITFYCWKYMLAGLENGHIPTGYIPQAVSFLSYWVGNLYTFVYLADEEHGQDDTSKIIRSLISLSIAEPAFTSNYVNKIWFSLNADGRLTNLIVTEIINQCLERDSENKDCTKITDLLTAFPTVELATDIINRLMDMIRFSLPLLKSDAINQSWVELKILVHITVYLFFESTLLTQMFLPEALYIISMLIDIGPVDLRTSLFELLMNICNSLVTNSILPSEIKQRLDDITNEFSKYKLKYIFGFSQYKSDVYPNISSGSFSIKFNILESFLDNILLLMEGPAIYESKQWTTKFKKYLSESVFFTSNSFLSARAIMLLGVAGKSHTTIELAKNLLFRTREVVSDPIVNTDNIFMLLSHVFAYSKIVEGLEAPFSLLKKMFWLAMAFTYADHAVIFEGGLIFMASTAIRLYSCHFESGSSGKTLVQELLEARQFAEPYLKEIEDINNIKWNNENFVSIIIVFLAKGLSIPFVRANAMGCLTYLFKSAYKECQIYSEATQYKSYMFLLFLTIDPDQFINILESVNYDSEIVVLNEQYKIPKLLEDWLCSDSPSSNNALYQGAMIFKNKTFDEPTKFKFLLLMKRLLDREPICLFRFYGAIELEIRRIASSEQTPKWIPLIFEIMGEVIRFSEFHDFNKSNLKSIERIKESGLEVILDSQLTERNMDESKMNYLRNINNLLITKKALIFIISRIIAPE